MNEEMTELKQPKYQMSEEKKELLDAFADWLEKNRDRWAIYTVTATFNSSGHKPNREKWIDWYKHKVIWKFNKRLSRRNKEEVILDFCVYEFNESSRFRKTKVRGKPHHVHGIIAVPINKANKIWNLTAGMPNSRLQRDLNSIGRVSSVEIQPMREGESARWIYYITKDKKKDVF